MQYVHQQMRVDHGVIDSLVVEQLYQIIQVAGLRRLFLTLCLTRTSFILQIKQIFLLGKRRHFIYQFLIRLQYFKALLCRLRLRMGRLVVSLLMRFLNCLNWLDLILLLLVLLEMGALI